jgi:CheY-like chemotaxis protein
MTEQHGTLLAHRVLIVEDEALIAAGVEEELRHLGCTDVFIAYHKSQALDWIERLKPKFAVVDVGLTEKGDNYEVADALARHHIPFIFASGHLPAEVPERHLSRPFVTKPMQSGDFATAVAIALAQLSALPCIQAMSRSK